MYLLRQSKNVSSFADILVAVRLGVDGNETDIDYGEPSVLHPLGKLVDHELTALLFDCFSDLHGGQHGLASSLCMKHRTTLDLPCLGVIDIALH